MRKLVWVPVLALAAMATGCSDDADPVGVPSSPEFELVDTEQRLAAADVNAWVFGSFLVELEGGGEPELVVLGRDGTKEEASFPGLGVFYGGHCIYGRWYNPRGKATSGNMDRPHPHCVGWSEGSGTIHVILEPISSKYHEPGESGNKILELGYDEACADPNDEDDLGLLNAKFIRAGRPADGHPQSKTEGCGLIVAHAIDLETIWNGAPTRIGQIEFDLAQFDEGPATAGEADLFDTDCGGVTEINGLTVAGCLTQVIDATYRAPNGDTRPIEGTLFWEVSGRTGGGLFNAN